jgi:non-haem Fe2+, alpha-ketoglutarate-dependent halogenase
MQTKFHLTSEQQAQFRRDGYIGPFDLHDRDSMREKYNSLRADLYDREYAIYDLPNDSPLVGYDRHLDIDFFSMHIEHPRIVDKVVSILGPNVCCWRSETFPKYPGDEGTDWHQADTFGHASGTPQIRWPQHSTFGGAITVWTALTAATEETGCLRFIPGTHEEMHYDESIGMSFDPNSVNVIEKGGVRRGFFGYDYRNLQKDADFVPDEGSAVSIVMEPGQFVIFWSTLMHASLPNVTLRDTRIGFAARYVPCDVVVYPDTDLVEEYGSELKLNKYGVVVVAGTGNSANREVLVSNRGYKFRQP